MTKPQRWIISICATIALAIVIYFMVGFTSQDRQLQIMTAAFKPQWSEFTAYGRLERELKERREKPTSDGLIAATADGTAAALAGEPGIVTEWFPLEAAASGRSQSVTTSNSGAPAAAAPPAQAAAPAIRGKFLIVDVDNDLVDALQLKLPEELRATRTDEVGVVLWISRRLEEVDRYAERGNQFGPGGTGSATRWLYSMTLVDKSVPAIIGKTVFVGEKPPELSKSKNNSGSPPSDEVIISYLSDLPVTRR